MNISDEGIEKTFYIMECFNENATLLWPVGEHVSIVLCKI